MKDNLVVVVYENFEATYHTVKAENKEEAVIVMLDYLKDNGVQDWKTVEPIEIDYFKELEGY